MLFQKILNNKLISPHFGFRLIFDFQINCPFFRILLKDAVKLFPILSLYNGVVMALVGEIGVAGPEYRLSQKNIGNLINKPFFLKDPYRNFNPCDLRTAQLNVEKRNFMFFTCLIGGIIKILIDFIPPTADETACSIAQIKG